ncbi:hypothetical protein AK88_05620, partial [Plasmodium fragile]
EGSPPGNNSRKEPPASAAGTSGPKVDEDGNKHNPKVDAPTPGETERKVVDSKTAETLLGTAVITTEITTTTYDPTGGVGMDTINKLLQEQEKKEKRTEEASNEPTMSAVVPDTKSTDSAGDSSKTKAADGESRNTENTKVEDHQPGSTGVQDAVVDGGNDDPPPPNPPKPKPNPNPNQSGSDGGPTSGEASTAGTEHGGGGGPGAPGGGGGGGGSGSSSSSASEPSGSGSTGEHTPGSSGPGSTGTSQPGTSGTGSSGGQQGAGSSTSGGQGSMSNDQTLPSLPPSKPFDPQDLVPYVPAIIPAVVGIGIIAFFLWKYFAYLAKRRRTYRTVRDVPSPPLDEDILDHLQRGELPPPAYGYTMVTQPASAAERRGQRPPRVHKRTIIELHLEVLNECEAADWATVQDDFYGIIVEVFARDLQPDTDTNNNILGVSTTKQGLSGTHVSSTDSAGIDSCPPNEDDPWSCMETIQLATGPCPPHDPDLWSCMETIHLATVPCPPNEDDRWNCMQSIQLDHEQTRPSDHGDATSACTQWITWIDRNKHIVRACTTEPWFLQLKADWKQYLREHMAQHAHNRVSGHIVFGEAATLQMRKLRLWKPWVAKQHALMNIYGAQEWFQHLLENIEEQIPATGEVPRVEKHLEVEKVMGTEHILIVRDVPRTQLHPQTYMQQPLTAQTWILILALVIEQCEVECRLHDRELYVDELLEQL